MDLKEVIIVAVRETLSGMSEARIALKDEVDIVDPAKIDLEFWINGSYELANWDEISNSKITAVRISIPFFKKEEAAKAETETKPKTKKK